MDAVDSSEVLVHSSEVDSSEVIVYSSEVDSSEVVVHSSEVREVRKCPHVELRVEGDDKKAKISGYAAVFGVQSEDLGGFVEQIQPGAFAKTLQEFDQRALWNHDDSKVLGRRKAGTLELVEDEIGLRFTIYPPDTQAGRDALESMRRGDVDQMSFAFQVVRDAWEKGARVVRTLKEVKLFEVSPVTFPAYPQTTAFVRSQAQQIKDDSDRGNTEQVPAAPVEDGQGPDPVDHPDGEALLRQRARAKAAMRKFRIKILATK